MASHHSFRWLDNSQPRRFTHGASSMTLQTGSRGSLDKSTQSTSINITWRGRIVLMLCSAILLPLAFAPYGQFYLAWIGLAPWLVLVSTARSQRAAFGWGWATGALYFLISFIYLLYNTI